MIPDFETQTIIYCGFSITEALLGFFFFALLHLNVSFQRHKSIFSDQSISKKTLLLIGNSSPPLANNGLSTLLSIVNEKDYIPKFPSYFMFYFPSALTDVNLGLLSTKNNYHRTK